jgi:hypothetical protein
MRIDVSWSSGACVFEFPASGNQLFARTARSRLRSTDRQSGARTDASVSATAAVSLVSNGLRCKVASAVTMEGAP